MPQLKFGTTGIRGDAEKLFTNQFSFDVGRAFGTFLKSHNKYGEVAVGMDPRESSPRIKSAIASGLIFEDFTVLDEGIVPIPAVNYILLAKPHLAGSLMISGSHIKAHLNGVKFFAFSEEIMKDHEAEITGIYNEIKEKEEFKNVSDQMEDDDSARVEYQNYLIAFAANSYPKWKIVLDPGNGAQSDIISWVLERLGLDVVEINASVQKQFFSRDTEVEGDFKDLQEKVKEVGADLGAGYDSDGDRVIFIDEKGDFIFGDYSGALIAREVGGNKVVTPVNSSSVVDTLDMEVTRTKVGSSQVISSMKKVGAMIGYEANGGVIFKELISRDGGRTTIEILNILNKKNQKLSELVSTLPKYYIARDKVDYKWELKDEIINKAKDKFKGIKTDETDGLKIWLEEDTWILFRSSSNAPEFRVFVESTSESKAHELLSNGLELVKEAVNG